MYFQMMKLKLNISRISCEIAPDDTVVNRRDFCSFHRTRAGAQSMTIIPIICMKSIKKKLKTREILRRSAAQGGSQGVTVPFMGTFDPLLFVREQMFCDIREGAMLPASACHAEEMILFALA